MIVAVVAVRMLEVAADAVIDVIPVRNRLVTATRAVDMTHFVTAAAMIRGAAVGVVARDVDYVLVDMILMGVMEVTVVQVVDVAAMTHGGVATPRRVLVGMVGVGGC
jgi:hypothetical protein